MPPRVSERTHFSLRHSRNFSIFPVRIVRFANFFFPSTTKLRNEAYSVTESTDLIGTFKNALVSYFQLPKYFKPFDYLIDRYTYIVHTRIRLDACALNYHLHRIGIKQSPACSVALLMSPSPITSYTVQIMLPRDKHYSPVLLVLPPTCGLAYQTGKKPSFLYLVLLY